MSPKFFLTLPVVLALVACGDQADEPTEPEPVITPPPAGETVSILRPDVEAPVEVAPAEPLVAVVPFAEGGSELTRDAILALREIAGSSEFTDGGAIILRGHSDAGGSDAVNMRASEARAETVKSWLVENGAAEERISVIAFGEQNPVAPNAKPDGTPDEDGRAANRRVEVTIMVAQDASAPSPNEPVPERDIAEEDESSA